VRIEETFSTMSANFIFQFTNTTSQTYNLYVSSGTSISANNGEAAYLSGSYIITVGYTQSSVIAGIAGQYIPYPLTNVSTIDMKYSMVRRVITQVRYKKDGFLKYIPTTGTNPTTGNRSMIDIDAQPLTDFSGNLPMSRIDGNLPASKLDNIDMSEVSTGNLDISRTVGNLPATRLDHIDMSKVSTGFLYQDRTLDHHLIVDNRFNRMVYPNAENGNTLNTSGIWTNRFRVQTNLHLNYYGAQYNYFLKIIILCPTI
jgi:hypothetical protein